MSDGKTEYMARFFVSTTEEEAREAFEKYHDEVGWMGSFQDHESDSHEMAARVKALDLLTADGGDDIDIDEMESMGVWYPEDFA